MMTLRPMIEWGPISFTSRSFENIEARASAFR
jgi:hypothetical protein